MLSVMKSRNREISVFILGASVLLDNINSRAADGVDHSNVTISVPAENDQVPYKKKECFSVKERNSFLIWSRYS